MFNEVENYITPSPKWFLFLQGLFTGFMTIGIIITLIHNTYKHEFIDWSYLSSQMLGIIIVNSNTILLTVVKHLKNYKHID